MNRKHRPFHAVLAVAIVVGLIPTAEARDPSPEYQASLRRTLELRRQRRRAEARTPVGEIALYPMPPVLIIRQTPRTHDEIQGLLDLLRYGGR